MAAAAMGSRPMQLSRRVLTDTASFRGGCLGTPCWRQPTRQACQRRPMRSRAEYDAERPSTGDAVRYPGICIRMNQMLIHTCCRTLLERLCRCRAGAGRLSRCPSRMSSSAVEPRLSTTQAGLKSA